MLRATIRSSAPLPLPSASGIELVGDTAYVISDDSPFLYRFRAADLTPNEPIRLFETAHFSAGRIPKTLKPDLEAITLLPPAADEPPSLLVAGSGATAAREQGFRVTLAADPPPAGVAVYPVSLGALYKALRQYLPGGQALNIEALAATPDHLWLFHRPVGTVAGRLGFRYNWVDAAAALRPPYAPPPTIRPRPYAVPDLDGHPSGLSGATFFGEKLFVTASVEITSDPVLDGEILGSFIGLLNPADPTRGQFAQLEWPNGDPFPEKVEGLAVRRQTATGYELLLVTDDDKGGSTVLVVDVSGA